MIQNPNEWFCRYDRRISLQLFEHLSDTANNVTSENTGKIFTEDELFRLEALVCDLMKQLTTFDPPTVAISRRTTIFYENKIRM